MGHQDSTISKLQRRTYQLSDNLIFLQIGLVTAMKLFLFWRKETFIIEPMPYTIVKLLYITNKMEYGCIALIIIIIIFI